MKYKIVIPTYNAGNRIYEILKGNYENGYEKFTIIDDGSQDNTSSEIKRFERDYGVDINLIELPYNTKKVGAIKEGVESVDSKYVFLLDDDTVICSHPLQVEKVCKKMEKENIKGATISVQPLNKKNTWLAELQKIEYYVADFTRKILGKYQRCIPGCAGIYERYSLLEALEKHSGEFIGDDFELTTIFHQLGYKTGYFDQIKVKTRIPESWKEKINQKTKWEKGSIRVYSKYWKHFLKEILKPKKLSFIYGSEILSHILLPYGVYRLLVEGDYQNFLLYFSGNYLGNSISSFLISANEKTNMKKVVAHCIFPAYYLGITVSSRLRAYKNIIEEKT